MYDYKKIKEELSIADVKKICSALGANPSQPEPNVLIMETVCHNPLAAGSRKLYYYDNSKLFKCYTECDSVFSIFELIRKIKKIETGEKISYRDAVRIMEGKTPLSLSFQRQEYNEEFSPDLEIVKKYNEIEEYKEIIFNYDLYNEDILKNLPLIPPKEWLEEGISIETMRRFGIKYYGPEHKIIIPHYNLQNELIGIRTRALAEEDVVNFGKYTPLRLNGKFYSHPLSKNLYGLNFNIKNINRFKKAIVFESEKAVMQYESLFGRENNIACATCGNSLSLYQIEILKKFTNIEELVIAYDKDFQTLGDTEYKSNVRLLKRLLNKDAGVFNTSVLFDKYNLLGYKDSPIDKGKEVFEYLFQNRIFQREV